MQNVGPIGRVRSHGARIVISRWLLGILFLGAALACLTVMGVIHARVMELLLCDGLAVASACALFHIARLDR